MAFRWLMVFVGLAANAAFFVATMEADGFQEVNPQVYWKLVSFVRHSPKILEISLKNLADKMDQEYEYGSREPREGEFCEPEFDPISEEMARKLPTGKKSLQKIREGLGKPCKEDEERIYYITNRGEVIFYLKETGEGGFL